MKLNISYLCFIFILWCNVADGQSDTNHLITYLSPKPGSFFNHISANIIIKLSSEISGEINPHQIGFIIESESSTLNYLTEISDDQKTILITPIHPLPAGSKVTVKLNQTVLMRNGFNLLPFSFYFYTNGSISNQFVNNEGNNFFKSSQNDTSFLKLKMEDEPSTSTISANINNQYPVKVLANNLTNKDYYFLSSISVNSSYPDRCMILNPEGKIIYDRIASSYTTDFKKLSDTLFTYFNGADNAHHILNEKFIEVDTIVAKNGYKTDMHDLVFDEKTGHYFLLAQENVIVNMADSIAGGNPHAYVLGLIIQELDHYKNVVFEWKTLDHLSILDSKGQDLTALYLDYVHCNAIELDTDTSFLLSSRHLNEITRIDRRTGAIIWRLGAQAAKNEFTFLNDTAGFTYQHDIRKLPNQHLTLFDNGNLRMSNTLYSRAVEYELNETNKTVKLVWQYRNSPDIYSDFAGSVKRMSNGNTLIGWGGAATTFTEVDSSNNKVMEVSMAPWAYSYRVYKYNIDSLIKQNQIKLNLADTLVFCNTDSNEVLSNLAKYVLPANTPPADAEIELENKNVTIFTQTITDFYNVKKSTLKFLFSSLNYFDTTICFGSSIKIAIKGNCYNAKLNWSTKDTSESIFISPKKTETYWVELKNGNYYRKDSVKVNVSEIPDFSIYGLSQYVNPFQIITYSVPFNTQYNYMWDVKNANIISGYGTNSITVQLGYVDTIELEAIILNKENCYKSAQLNITHLVANGLNNENVTSSYQIFPNPTNESFYINTKLDNFEYQILDLNGKKVKSGCVLLNVGDFKIDVSEIGQGIYTILLQNGENSETFKLEKLK